jgi:hypothetical protein
VAIPRPLAPDADSVQLATWLTEWSLRYPFGYDDQLQASLRPATGSYVVTDLRAILQWKHPRFPNRPFNDVHSYDLRHPGVIQRQTGRAFRANNDAMALAQLARIPWVKQTPTGSAVLMAMNPDRWTVFDRWANTTLVHLRDLLAAQCHDRTAPLHDLSLQLSKFRPQMVNDAYKAIAADWPSYIAICQKVSALTFLSLRTIDRACYESRGR